MQRKIAGIILTTLTGIPLVGAITIQGAEAATTRATTTRVYKGMSVSTNWGVVQTVIKVKGTRITAVKVVDPTHTARSQVLASRAVPVLVAETLAAQSARINTVSGATTISQAYITSLQSALNSAHL